MENYKETKMTKLKIKLQIENYTGIKFTVQPD